MPEPAATITTVLYNSAATLPAYARALEPSVEQGLVRVIAVDNASSDEGVTVLKRLLPDAEVIAAETNRGFAAGSNRAWPQVTTRYWLLLNPDVEAEQRAIEQLVSWMDAHPSVGVASPLLSGPGGHRLPVARPHDSLWRPLVELMRLHKLVPEPLRSRLLLSGHRRTPDTIAGWVPGAALIARSDAIARVGLLDEDLFMYGEDREWCWRIGRAGWKIGVCPTVEFLHLGGTSAVARWGEEERAAREVAGHLQATRKMRGARWTRVYALIVGLVLGAESLDPRRAEPTRREAALRSRLYLRAGVAGDRT